MAKLSPLADHHRRKGAPLVDREGWLMPLNFGDPLREYRSVRSGVGILDLCDRGLLRFEGPDRVSYLQGMVSNDLKSLSPGQGVYAAILDIQGKVLADTRIFSASDYFLLDLREPLKDKIVSHLNRYLIADEVEIADLTGEYGIVSLQGGKAGPSVKELFPHDQIPEKELDHCALEPGGAELRLIRCSHTGEEGYDLLLRVKDLESVVADIERVGKAFSLDWVGLEAQDILRIEAGIPVYGVDIDDGTLLLETGLDRLVSFQKGCYLGQEVVERIRSRGHVNKRLSGLILTGDQVASAGDGIRAGDSDIGRVTSSVLSPALQRPVAFGYLHRDYLQPGTLVSIIHDGQIIPAEVAALPFIKRQSR
ncbi:MAG: aminomethyl transferase family protein [Deltaproteobacteria bacterium]|nr:aminomethyl transferase family protein [Deltaproteobacteria bacterium]